MTRYPWEVTPSFTDERLRKVVSVIAAVRADCREGHLPEKGDNAWTFGCRAYRRSCYALATLALSGDTPWLVVQEHGLACTLMIGEEPIKFYKGDAENPSDRSLRRGLDEAVRQGKFSFYEDTLATGDGWFWLLAIETHEDGTVSRAAVFQVNKNKETRHLHFIPFEETVPVAAPAVTRLREGVDLPPPSVGPKSGIDDEASGDEEDAGSDDSE